MSLDPRDKGEPGVKEWAEFRSSYAAAFLLSWLSEEATDLLEEYADNLHGRFMSGWDIQDLLLEPWPDEPPEERPFPLPPIGGVERDDYHDHLIWMDDWEARLLYQQLFPHRDSLSDFPQTVGGLAVVALHAAFEAYAKSQGVHLRGPLPRAVERFLGNRGAAEKQMPRRCDDSSTATRPGTSWSTTGEWSTRGTSGVCHTQLWSEESSEE